jgi:hypothetical protein
LLDCRDEVEHGDNLQYSTSEVVLVGRSYGVQTGSCEPQNAGTNGFRSRLPNGTTRCVPAQRVNNTGMMTTTLSSSDDRRLRSQTVSKDAQFRKHLSLRRPLYTRGHIAKLEPIVLTSIPTGCTIEDRVGLGTSGLVFLDSSSSSSSTVIKFPHTGDIHALTHIEIEKSIYNRFTLGGGHEGLLDYDGPFEAGLRLEYAKNEGLLSYLQQHKGDIGFEQRFRWCQEVSHLFLA